MITKFALIDSLATAAYVAFVGVFLYYAPQIFTSIDTILTPILMLLLLVFSASVTGSLIFGRPVLWYLDGKKSEALRLLIYTLAYLFVTTVVVLLVYFLYVRATV